MKCRKNKFKYKIPAFSSMMSVFIRGKMYDVNICRITSDQMASMDKSNSGVPACYFAQGTELILWPTPDKSYEVMLYYAPPIAIY